MKKEEEKRILKRHEMSLEYQDIKILYRDCVEARLKEWKHEKKTGKLRMDDNGMTKDSNIFAEFGTRVELIMIDRLEKEIK